MVAKGSPKLTMIARASPKAHRFMAATSQVVKKKASPKGNRAKKTGGSLKVPKQRADWNLGLERSLVDILHEFKDSGYRGDTGCWSSEGWNKMVKEFHLRNKYVNYTKSQIQDKETQLKRDYRMLKLARQQSGASWNEHRNMVEGPPSLWANLKTSYPKIKKFHNSKATFPLYDALEELYDGHLAEGNYNITSLELTAEKEPLHQIHDVEDLDNTEVHEVLDEDDDDSITEMQASEAAAVGDESEVTVVERSGQRVTPTTHSQDASNHGKRPKKGEKEGKRPRRGERIEDIMGRYVDMRTKQVEDESADLAKEKEATEVNDFSITRCISVLSTVEMTTEEKAKAFQVFIKSKEHREAFLSGCQVDKDATLLWLKSMME